MSKLKYETGIFNNLLNNKLIVLASNVIFQGMRYMTLGELVYKLILTLLLCMPLFLFGLNLTLSIIFGHLLNYIINGQFYVVFRYLSSKTVMTHSDLKEFLRLIESNVQTFGIRDVLILGSFCRGKMNPTSDLDIRIYHERGISPSIKAYVMATKLRFCGLLMKFPIDVYCFSDLSFLDKIDRNEIPASLMMEPSYLRSYPSAKSVCKSFEELTLK